MFRHMTQTTQAKFLVHTAVCFYIPVVVKFSYFHQCWAGFRRSSCGDRLCGSESEAAGRQLIGRGHFRQVCYCLCNNWEGLKERGKKKTIITANKHWI